MAALTAGAFTPEGFAEALLRFGDSINPSIRRALETASETPYFLYVERFASRGVGRGIFGRKRAGAYKLVKVGVDGPRGEATILRLELHGFAALQETGGRTDAHEIKPSSARKALRFNGNVFRRAVQHPGSRIAAHPAAPEALRQSAPRIRREIDKAVAEFSFHGVRIATSRAT